MFFKICYNHKKIKKVKTMENMLEIEREDFLHTLTTSDKRIVKKAIDLYHDFIEYKDALKISKSIENGTIKTYPADEVFKEIEKSL